VTADVFLVGRAHETSSYATIDRVSTIPKCPLVRGIKRQVICRPGLKHVADKAGGAITNRASIRELARIDATPASIADYAHYWRVANWQMGLIGKTFS
jgi:hypothetical protein